MEISYKAQQFIKNNINLIENGNIDQILSKCSIDIR